MLYLHPRTFLVFAAMAAHAAPAAEEPRRQVNYLSFSQGPCRSHWRAMRKSWEWEWSMPSGRSTATTVAIR